MRRMMCLRMKAKHIFNQMYFIACEYIFKVHVADGHEHQSKTRLEQKNF